MVVAALAADRVVARAAKKLVASLATLDHVVARAAVDGHHAAGGARVDHVVARVVKADAQAGGDARLAVVTRTVLRGVAVDHQCRAAVGEGDGVAGDVGRVATAVHHREAAMRGRGLERVVDREAVIALAEQNLGNLHVAVGDAAREGLGAGREIVGAEGDIAGEAQTRHIGAGGGITVEPEACAHDTRVVGDAGIVVDRQRVDQCVLVNAGARDGGQRHIGLARQDDRRLDGTVGRRIDIAFDEQRASHGAHHMGLDREGLEGLRRQGWLRIGSADHHGLRQVPVGRGEGQRQRCRGGEPVRQHGHGDRCCRGLGQPDGICVGARLVGQCRRVVGDNQRRAFALVNQQASAVVVHNLHIKFRRAIAGGGVRDRRQQRVFHHTIVHRRHSHQHSDVPVAAVEGDGVAGRVVAAVDARHRHLRIGTDGNHHRAGSHSLAQLDGVGVGDTGNRIAFQHLVRMAGAGHDDFGPVVVLHRDPHVFDRDMVERCVGTLRAVADRVDALAFVAAIVHRFHVDGLC